MNRKLIKVVVPVLILIELSCIFLACMSYSNKNVNEVIETNEINKEQFAMYIENSNGSYDAYNENSFPSGYALNEEKSVCVNLSGDEVPGVLSYKGGNLTITSNKTVYCYLYFDSVKNFGEYLINNPTAGLNSDIEGGMYRYQGTTNNVDNYVCFGTTDKNTCISNPDLYMYMVIGVVGTADAGMGTEVNMVKLLKKEALNSTYRWSELGDYYWNPNATNVAQLLTGINGSYYLTNTGTYSYFSNSTWLNKIADLYWRYNDYIHNGYNVSAAEIYAEESAFVLPTTAKKISLMYIHDYYYAYQSGGLNCSAEGTSYSTCKESWMHLSQTDSGAPSPHEWSMTHAGYWSNYPYNFVIRGTGEIEDYYTTNYYSARPVFYLTTDVKWSSGSGTSNDPFILD